MTRALGPLPVETRACARREAIGRHRSSGVAAWGADRFRLWSPPASLRITSL